MSNQPSDPKHNTALVDAIDALTAEVARLRDAVASLQNSNVDSSAAPVASASPSTPVVPTLPTPSSVPEPMDPDQDPGFRAVDMVVAGLFLAAQDTDADAGFEAFLELMHTDRIDAPRSIPSLKEFNWKSLRKNYQQFLSDSVDCSSFKVVDRRPDVLSDEVKVVKVFLHAESRSPVPVQLKRDPAKDDQWRVTDSSL